MPAVPGYRPDIGRLASAADPVAGRLRMAATQPGGAG